MRISEKKVVQLIDRELGEDDTIVIVDESTGNEVELSGEELWEVIRAARTFGVLKLGVVSLPLSRPRNFEPRSGGS